MLTVADVMTRRPVMVPADATVAEALEAMKARGISSGLVPPLPGLSEYGIVTARDILTKVVRDDLDPTQVHLHEIMTWRLVTARPAWTVAQAAGVMGQVGVRRLPVVEGGEIVGLVSDTDLFTALAPQQEWEHVRRVRKARAEERASRTGTVRTVADVMSSPVLTIGPDATVAEAVRKMVAAGVSSLLVTEDGPAAQGIVTKRDVVLKLVAAERDPAHVRVGAVMSAPVRTIEPGVTIEACSARMAEAGVRRFPVARPEAPGEILGIVSDSDILAAVEARRWQGHRRPRWPTAYIVADVMRPPAGPFQTWEEALSPELSLWEAAGRMRRAGVRQLPVVQEGAVIGVVSDTDIVRALEQRGGGD